MNKKLKRIFIAIDFPQEVTMEVARIQEVLGTRKFTGKMTELENLHLTLKFIGEVNEGKIEEIRAKLKEIIFSELDARLDGIGSFSFRGSPRVVWIKIGGKRIFELQKKVDEKMRECGFKTEERFMSHMTIARIKYVKDKQGFIDYVRGIKGKEIKFSVKEFKLKESELRTLGPVYRDVEIYSST
ncbi:MAG: RNA 2',3'-cyclic phosphodiesterase [Nanoarchaeota archaeon]|nr:RNA 2',3'-cyclic phosphodiesterase [Nanoarchaeota archaeon]